jgi:general secretion pathway protein H
MRAISATGRGFTLIELLVVIAIVTTLAALLPVAIDRALPGRRVAATAQRLVSALRDAQSDSLATGEPVHLEFRENAGLVRASKLAVAFPSATQVRLADAEGRPVHDLTAYPDGSMVSARFEVSERSHHAAVVISGITGRVALGEGSDGR